MLSIYVPSLVYSIGNGALTPVLVLAALDLGFTDAGASAVLGLFGVVGVISAPILGRWISRLGERPSLIVAGSVAIAALVLSLVSLLGPGETWAKAAFLIGLSFLAMAFNVWSLARQAYVAEALPVMWRARGLSTLGGMIRIGALIGPLLATALVALWSFASVFALSAVTSALALLMVVMFVVPDPRQLQSAPDHQSDDDDHAESPTTTSARLDPIAADPPGVHRPDTIATFIAGLGVTALAVLRANRMVIVPLWGTALEFSPEMITATFAVSALADTALFYPAGKIMDRRGRLWALLPAMLTMSLAITLMLVWQTPVGFVVSALIMGAGNGMGAGIVMTMGADLSPPRHRANFLGLWQAIGNAGQAAGPFVASGLTAAVGVGAALWSTAGIGLAGALWFALMLPRAYKRIGLDLRGNIREELR